MFADVLHGPHAFRVIPIGIGLMASYEKLMDALREPVVVLNWEMRVISAGRSFYQRFDLSAEEAEGKSLFDLGNREWDIPKLRELLEDILPQKKECDDFEIEFNSKNIGRRRLLLNARWIYGKTHQRPCILMAIEDVTEVREMARLLEIKDKMASLGRVSAGIVHEMKNPLTGINIYLNTLEKIYNQAHNLERVKRILDQVKSASGKIETIVRKVLDFSRPSEHEFVPASINNSIKKAINLFKATRQRDGIKIEQDLTENLPLCRSDPILIEQAVLNLIVNAAEAIKNIKERKRIEVTSSIEDNRIVVGVSDSGQGVPVNLKDKIFSPFYTTKSEGTGIGLNIARRIITDHGGSLNIGTSQWGGAKFVIEIPIKQMEGIPVLAEDGN